MRFLFVHQNFPGQYLHIARHLAADPRHDVVFASEISEASLPGVRRVCYEYGRKPRADLHPCVRDWDSAVQRSERVAAVARNLIPLGFKPDIIIGHHGWGEMLHLADMWPDVPMLGYFEFYYHPQGYDVNFDPEFPMPPNSAPLVRSMNTINHAALALGRDGQSPTRFQRDAYPEWARAKIKLLPEGAKLDLCRPDPAARKADLDIDGLHIAPGDKLITYVARNLEPYRGFHIMMRALPRLLAERPDVKVVMVGGDDVSYGARLEGDTWRQHLTRQLPTGTDLSRVRMPGQVPYETYLNLLQRSDAHVYLTYPFVASWSLREALACGCTVVASDVEPVREFITDGRNGRLIRPLDPAHLADTVLELLEDDAQAKRLRHGARRFAEQNLDMHQHIAAFEARIAELVG
jgi:glycosyltransferase involved in cell wall biosynthesis